MFVTFAMSKNRQILKELLKWAKMKLRQNKNAGFSLIELLFAILFLSVIVFGVIRLQTSNLTIGNTQQNELQANFYVTQALEIATALGKNAVSGCQNGCYISQGNNGYSLGNTPEELGEIPFERSIKASSEGLSNAFLIIASVTWEDSAGSHEVSGMRIVSK